MGSSRVEGWAVGWADGTTAGIHARGCLQRASGCLVVPRHAARRIALAVDNSPKSTSLPSTPASKLAHEPLDVRVVPLCLLGLRRVCALFVVCH